MSPKSDFSWNESLSGVIRALPDATAFTRALLVAANPLALRCTRSRWPSTARPTSGAEDNANYLATVERTPPSRPLSYPTRRHGSANGSPPARVHRRLGAVHLERPGAA